MFFSSFKVGITTETFPKFSLAIFKTKLERKAGRKRFAKTTFLGCGRERVGSLFGLKGGKPLHRKTAGFPFGSQNNSVFKRRLSCVSITYANAEGFYAVKPHFSILLSILLLLTLTATVFAVGIRPARLVYPFQEGRELSLEYTVINRASVGARFAIYVCGTFYDKIQITDVSSTIFSDLDCTAAQRKVINQLEDGDITLDQAGIFLNPHEEKGLRAKITMPAVTGFQPGIVETRVGTVDLPLTFKPGETVVGGIAAVEAQLWFKVPYQGKRFLLAADVPDVEWGKKAKIKMTVTSEGTEEVKNAVLTADIMDPLGVRKDRLSFDPKDIASGESAEYNALWDTKQVDPGTYKLLMRFSFDGQAVTHEQEFRIGGLEVAITGIDAQPVAKGGIAKIVISASSKWGDTIKGVFADIEVVDKAGKQVGTAKTQSADMPPFAKQTFEGFWETASAPTGSYDLLVKVRYADKTTEGKGILEIKDTVYQQTPAEYIWLAVAVILAIAGLWFFKDKIKIAPAEQK